jgi:hypothetical protein
MQCEATAEDKVQVRELARRLALDGAATSSQPVAFVKLEHPAEVAVIVPHTLHFGDVEHLDYTELVDSNSRIAVQASESPMPSHRPPSTSSLDDFVNNDLVGQGGGREGGGADEGGRREGGGAPLGRAGSTSHARRTSAFTSSRAPAPAQAHPTVVWLAIALTGLGTGLVSVVLTNISVGFGNTRLQEANQLLELHRPLAAGAVWVVFSVIFTAAAAAITVYYAPQAASTGIPETKAFLHGCDVRGVFSLQTFVVKATGVCLVIAAGAPVGLEGPMVHIGAMAGGKRWTTWTPRISHPARRTHLTSAHVPTSCACTYRVSCHYTACMSLTV